MANRQISSRTIFVSGAVMSYSQCDVVGGGRRHRAHALGAVFALGQLVGVVVGVEQLIRLWNNSRGNGRFNRY